MFKSYFQRFMFLIAILTLSLPLVTQSQPTITVSHASGSTPSVPSTYHLLGKSPRYVAMYSATYQQQTKKSRDVGILGTIFSECVSGNIFRLTSLFDACCYL